MSAHRGPPVPVRSGHFRWREHRLHYEVWGDSGTPCLLMHGLLLDSLMNRDLARRFVGEGYQVVLLDFLGHGGSDKPTDPREHRIEFLGEQGLACLDHLGIERALVGGCSLGANASLHLAAMAPSRCLGLFVEMPVMEWSTTFAGVLFLPLLTATDYLRGLIRPFARGLRRLPRPRWESAASALNAVSAEPRLVNAILHGYVVGATVPPVRARRALDMPALVIGHGWDRLHELRDAVALARELPRGRLIKARSILELRVRPQRLWPDIQAHLQAVRDGTPGRRRPRRKAPARRRDRD